MDGMFVRDSNKELQCSYSPSNILEKISNKLSQLNKQVKKYYKNALTEHNDEFQEYQTAIADYSKSYEEIWTKFSQIVVIAKKIQVSWQNFGSLKNFFDKVFWPEMECEMSLRDLESQIDSTTQKLKITKEKKPKYKLVSAALRVSPASSNTADSSMKSADLVESATTTLDVVPTPLVTRTDHPPYVADLATGSSGLDTALYVSSASVFNTAAPKKREEKSRFYKVIRQPDAKENKSRAVSLVGKMQEWMGNLKKGKQVKFDNMLQAFERYLGAEIEQSQLTEITFRGDNQKLTKIFCHKPHGSQSKKAWPAWRYHMIRGLMAAGFEF